MKFKNNNPIEYAQLKETTHIFMGLCSFVSIINNKKINLPNIFILILKNKKLRDFYKLLLDIETDFELVKMFLYFEPSLYKSKYIMKYINSKRKNLIM